MPCQGFSGNWYRVDDYKVMSLELKEALSQGSCMLLYNRVAPRSSYLITGEPPSKEEVKARIGEMESPNENVDYGVQMKGHLIFLVACCGAFSSINNLKVTFVHSGNSVAAKHLNDGRKYVSLIKSYVEFRGVSIPSTSTHIRQFNLYFEIVVVAVFNGSISHANRLIDVATCLQSVNLTSGFQV